MQTPVVLMEDHHEAYTAWKKQSFKNRILVHLDPHIDFGWIADEDPQNLLNSPTRFHLEANLKKRTPWNFSGTSVESRIHIGNFIYPAIREGMVRAFYWVVPDEMAKTAKDRRNLMQIFLNLKRIFPSRVSNLCVDKKGVRCLLDGVPAFACSLSSLPRFSETVLLDIDTDFFVIRKWSESYPYFDPDDLQMWLTPAELVQRLRDKVPQTDFITISYSVDGGFTPPDYKYLGDELKNRLQGVSPENKMVRSRHAGEYGNTGKVYQFLDRWEKSREVYEAALKENPQDPYALCGLGNYFAKQKNWSLATEYYKQALEIKPGLEEANSKLDLMLRCQRLRLPTSKKLDKLGNETRLIRNAQISGKYIEDEIVLLDRKKREVVRLNSVAAEVWQTVNGERTVGEIVTHISSLFEGGTEQIKKDVFDFLKKLLKQKVLERSQLIPVMDGRKFFGAALGKQRFPLNGQWELTCRCNLHCVMCYTDPLNQPARILQELSTTEILRILDEIAKEGCLNLVLTGGEPLARPDFFEIYEAAHAKGIFLTVFTNGTLITEKTADRFAQFPPERIEISLHGMSRPIFEKITTGKGSFDRCLKAIDLLMERKIPLTLKTTAMTLNETEILAVKKYADRLKTAGDVRFRLSEKVRRRLVGFDSANSSSLLRGRALPALDIDDVSQFQVSEDSLRKMESQDEELIRAHLEELESSKTPYTCASQFHSFHIDAYGRLQMCSGNRRGNYDLRKGSFREGFYQAMPHFPCAFKIAGTKTVG